jgi:hypothetical protein
VSGTWQVKNPRLREQFSAVMGLLELLADHDLSHIMR